MKLNKVRLGDYIKLVKEKCNISNLTPDDVSGINRDKEFFEPSKQVSGDTSNYKIVPPGCFACNIMHVGRDVVLPIALNHTDKNKIVSPAYTVFEWTSEKMILKEYLFMLLKSTEKDRYFWFHCDSSVRDGMDWNAFCDIELEVPNTDIQRKYVEIYIASLNNLKSFEKGLIDLKLVCDAYIEKLRHNLGDTEIGPYISQVSERNKSKTVNKILGISKEGFIPPMQTPGDLENYFIFQKDDFVYSPPRINVGSIGLYKGKEKAVCSPIYVIFRSRDCKILNPDYLMLWFKRSEFLRSTDFYSIASVRNNFSYELMEKVKVSIPDIEIQKDIVAIFAELERREKFVLKIKEMVSKMCPVLIKGSFIEGQKGAN